MEEVVDFDVESGSVGFRNCIQRLRVKLTDSQAKLGCGKGIPVLHLERAGHPPPLQYVNLCIRNRQLEVFFCLNKTNVYLVGFRNGEGHWFELTMTNETIIPDAEPLPVGGSYKELKKSSGFTVDELLFGQMTLETALHYFNKCRSDSKNFRADCSKKLLMMVVLICECVRYKSIEKLIAPLMDNLVGQKLPTGRHKNFNVWAKASSLLQDPTKPLTFVISPLTVEKTVEDFVRAIGIMKAEPPEPKLIGRKR